MGLFLSFSFNSSLCISIQIFAINVFCKYFLLVMDWILFFNSAYRKQEVSNFNKGCVINLLLWIVVLVFYLDTLRQIQYYTDFSLMYLLEVLQFCILHLGVRFTFSIFLFKSVSRLTIFKFCISMSNVPVTFFGKTILSPFNYHCIFVKIS